MTVLPIVGRELRVASRRRSTYWLRTGTALGVLGVFCWVFLAMSGQSSADLGKVLFYVLTGCTLFYCLLSGVRSTADCLSEEKREGTLGLLFLTDLKGYDVVLGKLAANSLNSFYAVLATVPMLAITLMMGGVAPGEFARVSLVLVTTMFFSLSAGMLVSALSRNARKAMSGTFLLIVFFAGGLPALGGWVAYATDAGKINPAFLLPSPAVAYGMVLETSFRGLNPNWIYSVGLVGAFGLVFLALAVLIAPRSWQERPGGARKAQWNLAWRSWVLGGTEERRVFRRRLLDRNAFFWLAARVRFRPVLVWLTLAAGAGFWIWGALKIGEDWFNEGNYIMTAVLLNCVLKGWVASEAGRQLAEDRKAGTLELLLSTPLSVRDILAGQRMALLRQFLLPVALVLCLEVVMFVAGLLGSNMRSSEFGWWVALCLAAMIALVADLGAIYWLGMWMGLTAKNPNRVTGDTLVRLLVLPWVVFLCFLVLVQISQVGSGGGRLGPVFFIVVWLGMGLFADVVFGSWARRKLLTEFRVVAMSRYQAQSTIWQRLFGRTAE